MRRSLAAGIWLALTVTATLIVWTAVSVVAADVTDRPAPVVAHRDVVVALQAGSDHPSTTTTSTAVPRPVIPTTSPLPAIAPPTTVAARGGPTTTAAAQPTPTTVARVTTTTKAPVRPVTPTTTVLPPGTATYSTGGGIVAVACTGFNSIRLVAALPNDGFQAVVISGGPFGVQVSFVAPGRNISVSAACFFSQPFEYTRGQTPPSGPPTT